MSEQVIEPKEAPTPDANSIEALQDRVSGHLAKIQEDRGESVEKSDTTLDPAPEKATKEPENTASPARDAATLARASLGKAGLKSDLIEGIDDDALIAMGRAVEERLASQQRSTQGIVEERNSLAAQLKSLDSKETEADSKASVDEEHTEDPRASALHEKGYTDEEVVQILKVVGPAPTPVEEKPVVPEVDVQAQTKAAAEAELVRIRTEMVKSHPDLSQDSEWEAQLVAADRLLVEQADRYKEAEDPIMAAFEDAVAANGYAPTAQVETRSSGPTVPATASRRDFLKLDRNQRIAEVLRLKEAGVGESAIAALYGR